MVTLLSRLVASGRVAEGAALSARELGADVVVCGHTHVPLVRRFADASGAPLVTYVNSGSWVERPATFLTVDASGVRVNRYR